MATYPAFLFYAEDFTAGTAAMSPTAVGIYIRCLCYQWSHGSVPSAEGRVARLSGATKEEITEAWPELILKFVKSADGTMQNQRLEAVRAELMASIKKRKKAGKAGAKARWQTQCERNAIANADAMRLGMRNGCDDDGKTMASRVEDSITLRSAATKRAEVQQVFDHYRTYHARSFPSPTAKQKEWKLISSRLSEGYSVEDLKAAIDGNHRSPFHCGLNDRQTEYHALELIMRSADKVQEFIKVPVTPEPVRTQKEMRGMAGAEQFIQEGLGHE